jgi:hypothetical protein
MIESRKVFFTVLIIILLIPHLFGRFQENETGLKKDDIYSTYLKIKNNFNDEKFWNSSEVSKNKKIIKYDEFDDIKKNIIKQIIVKSCRTTLSNRITELTKENKEEDQKLIYNYKNAIKDLDNIDKKLKIYLYAVKPEWFTELDKEIFLGIKNE